MHQPQVYVRYWPKLKPDSNIVQITQPSLRNSQQTLASFQETGPDSRLSLLEFVEPVIANLLAGFNGCILGVGSPDTSTLQTLGINGAGNTRGLVQLIAKRLINENRDFQIQRFLVPKNSLGRPATERPGHVERFTGREKAPVTLKKFSRLIAGLQAINRHPMHYMYVFVLGPTTRLAVVDVYECSSGLVYELQNSCNDPQHYLVEVLSQVLGPEYTMWVLACVSKYPKVTQSLASVYGFLSCDSGSCSREKGLCESKEAPKASFELDMRLSETSKEATKSNESPESISSKSPDINIKDTQENKSLQEDNVVCPIDGTLAQCGSAEILGPTSEGSLDCPDSSHEVPSSGHNSYEGNSLGPFMCPLDSKTTIISGTLDTFPLENGALLEKSQDLESIHESSDVFTDNKKLTNSELLSEKELPSHDTDRGFSSHISGASPEARSAELFKTSCMSSNASTDLRRRPSCSETDAPPTSRTPPPVTPIHPGPPHPGKQCLSNNVFQTPTYKTIAHVSGVFTHRVRSQTYQQIDTAYRPQSAPLACLPHNCSNLRDNEFWNACDLLRWPDNSLEADLERATEVDTQESNEPRDSKTIELKTLTEVSGMIGPESSPEPRTLEPSPTLATTSAIEPLPHLVRSGPRYLSAQEYYNAVKHLREPANMR